ncbi:MAG TPA: HAD family phosphatase [Methanocella sp.]|nr:HAD family phosphatase [Methanocella sp.]
MAEHCSIFITRYRAALFDMDGVVADTMPLHLKAWQEVFRSCGVAVDAMDVYLREGMQSAAMARGIAQEKGVRLTDEALEEMVAEKTRMFDREAAGARAYDGVPGTLRMLRNNGLRIALVTGSKAGSAETVLEAAGVRDLFDVVVTGDDTRKGKPDPDPYLKAIDKVHVNPLDCLVVENAPLGIRSAKAAGIGYVIGVTTTLAGEYLLEADDIMGSLAELEQCLARRFAARPVI